MTTNKIFWKPPRNKVEVALFHRPFVEFYQTFSIRGEKKVAKTFACNGIINEQRKICIVPVSVKDIIEEYAYRKCLKKNAVVESSIFKSWPYEHHPITTTFHVDCLDSRQSIIKFEWDINEKLSTLKEIVIV